MRTALNWIAIGWAGVLLSSLVSMMAVFLGSASRDLHGLLQLQSTLVPVALLAVVFYLVHASRHTAGAAVLPAIWRHTPGWLVFTVMCAASLTLIAELTFLLVGFLAETPRPWREHVPAVSAIVSAMALAIAYAHLSLTATD